MKMNPLILLVSFFCCCNAVVAKPLQDLSGTYKCTITDAHDGVFVVNNIFTLDKQHSTNQVAGYNVTVLDEHNKPSNYAGFASFDGHALAMYSANKDSQSASAKTDYAVIIAKLTKNGFISHYYQPTYNGGNTGSSQCSKVANSTNP